MWRAALAACLLALVAWPAAVMAAPPPPAVLAPGSATVATAQELLQALEQGISNITLAGDVSLTPDALQQFQLPIQIAENATVLIRGGNPGTVPVLDWGAAINVLDLEPGSTLVLDGIVSANPASYSGGLASLNIESKGSFLWPSITGDPGYRIVVNNSVVFHDVAGCSPQLVEGEISRLAKILGNNDSAVYLGGMSSHFTHIPGSPIPIVDTLAKQQVGSALFDISNVTLTCFDSLAEPAATSPAPSSSEAASSSGSGTQAWVWAVVGSVAGVAVLGGAALGGYWRRRQRRLGTETLAAAPAAAPEAEATGDKQLTKGSRLSSSRLSDIVVTASEEPQQASGHSSDPRSDPTGPPASLASDAPSAARRTSADVHLRQFRVGAIEDVQLGDLLGKGSFGRVYKGWWRGAPVAVKIIEHHILEGQVQDLAREPLLSMSVSHPNVLTTHKVSVVRLVSEAHPAPRQAPEQQPAADLADQSAAARLRGASRAAQAGQAGPPSSATSQLTRRSQGSSVGGGSTGQPTLVPTLRSSLDADSSHGGCSVLAEVVSPGDELQPGPHETWLVTELCDRGSLADLIGSRGRMPADPQLRHVWVLQCLLDIAQGLDYLHSCGMVHVDLKPGNVLLRSVRNDRRGFVCKLADFGLSRMLGHEQTHVDTGSFGTPSFAAPELVCEGRLDRATDIFALGMVMWELEVGQQAHPGRNAMQIIFLVTQKRYRPPIPPSCPPPLASLMQRCWAHDAADRPAASAVVAELHAMLVPLSRSQSLPMAP